MIKRQDKEVQLLGAEKISLQDEVEQFRALGLEPMSPRDIDQ